MKKKNDTYQKLEVGGEFAVKFGQKASKKRQKFSNLRKKFKRIFFRIFSIRHSLLSGNFSTKLRYLAYSMREGKKFRVRGNIPKKNFSKLEFDERLDEV